MFPPDWKAIASEARELDIRSAIPIGEGWTAVAYRVNEELVFKVPKGPEDWQEQDREIALGARASRALAPKSSSTSCTTGDCSSPASMTS